jgi:hypothetical protein
VRRIAYLIALVACCDLVAEGAAAGTPSYATNSNPVVFPKQAHPYGADMTTWGERAAAWIVGQPFAHNPLFDQTGADCANGTDPSGLSRRSPARTFSAARAAARSRPTRRSSWTSATT